MLSNEVSFPGSPAGPKSWILFHSDCRLANFSLSYQDHRCFVVLSVMKTCKNPASPIGARRRTSNKGSHRFCPFQRVERWILLHSWLKYLFEPYKNKSCWVKTELLANLMRSVTSILPNVVHLKQWRKLLSPSWQLSIQLKVLSDIHYRSLM